MAAQAATPARLIRVLFPMGLAVAVGCQTTTTRSIPTTPAEPPRSTATEADVRQAERTPDAGVGIGPDAGPGMTADEAVSSDASAARLHDIEGTLLMYQALHHRLPASLAELKPLADPGDELPITAPSGRPYLYAPGGLAAAGATKRIIVADPAPSAAGLRWCILMPPPAGLGAPLSMEVVAMPERLFRAYAPE